MSRPVLVVEHEADASLDLMAPALQHLAEVVRPYRGETLPDPEFAGWSGHFGGLVVLGGEMAAWEDDVAPWLPAVRSMLRAAVRAKLPTLGICLGAQLLAHATGGRAERGDAGLEIGPVTVTPTEAIIGDPFTGAAMFEAFSVLTYHRDAVTALPADAEVLATGDDYPIQAFRVGERAWGVQYHPEVSVTGFEQWLAGLPADFADLDILRAAVRDAAEPQRGLATTHAEAFVQAAGLPWGP